MEENLQDDWGDNAIVKISNKELKRFLIRKRLGKICECKNRTVLVDFENRRLECSECGAILDPFDIVKELTFQDHRRYSYLKSLREEKEQLQKWMLNNRMGSTLRNIASYLRQNLLPKCPHCNEAFELENITGWVSKEYAVAKYLQKLNVESNGKN